MIQEERIKNAVKNNNFLLLYLKIIRFIALDNILVNLLITSLYQI